MKHIFFILLLIPLISICQSKEQSFGFSGKNEIFINRMDSSISFLLNGSPAIKFTKDSIKFYGGFTITGIGGSGSTDSAVFYTVYRSDTSRTNIYAAINGKQVSGSYAVTTNNLSDLSNAATARTNLSLGNVENTALSTWIGTTNINTVGTIGTGTWNATAIADGKIASNLTGKTYNGLTINTTTGTLAITNGKTLSASNTLTFSGTDGSSLNVGAGGTLGTNAFTSTSYQPLATNLTSIGALANGSGFLKNNGSGIFTYESPAGSGTVTDVSVVSANGFAGSVANSTSTPAITISTSITGILKGNGTAISAASAGTDYLTPSSNGSLLTGLTTSQITGYAGYSIQVQALTSSPTDAQTVYFGMLPKAPVTAAATSKVYVRASGTITAAEIYCYSGTAGTNEAWSLYIRVNNTTDYLIATVSASTNERIFTNSSLSISLSANDYFEIKGVQPTWATNPLTTIYGGYVKIN